MAFTCKGCGKYNSRIDKDYSGVLVVLEAGEKMVRPNEPPIVRMNNGGEP
ncbi:hypothetical protein [Halobacillus dabanensis]|nr:hypothetical protein [Halobacillus dabanensis]